MKIKTFPRGTEQQTLESTCQVHGIFNVLAFFVDPSFYKDAEALKQIGKRRRKNIKALTIRVLKASIAGQQQAQAQSLKNEENFQIKVTLRDLLSKFPFANEEGSVQLLIAELVAETDPENPLRYRALNVCIQNYRESLSYKESLAAEDECLVPLLKACLPPSDFQNDLLIYVNVLATQDDALIKSKLAVLKSSLATLLQGFAVETQEIKTKPIKKIEIKPKLPSKTDNNGTVKSCLDAEKSCLDEKTSLLGGVGKGLNTFWASTKNSAEHYLSSAKLSLSKQSLFSKIIPAETDSQDYFNWAELPEELIIDIMSFLELKDILRLANTSRLHARLAKDSVLQESLSRTWYHRWQRYTTPPMPNSKIKEPKSYKEAFRHLYFSLSPKERILVHAAVTNNNEKLAECSEDKKYIKDKACRDRLLIIGAVNGDEKLLRYLDCTYIQICRLALASYITQAPNRQGMRNYFWGIAKNTRRWRRFTPSDVVNQAVMFNQPAELNSLLEKDPTLAKQANSYHITPLMVAKHFMIAKPDEFEDCIRILREHGAEDIKLTPELIKQFNEHLIEAVRSYEVRKPSHLNSALVLLANGASPDYQDTYGETALFQPASAGSTEALRLLLPCVTNINTASKRGLTALIEAAVFASEGTVSLLLGVGANPNSKANDEDTALKKAAYKFRNFGTGKAACLLAVAEFLTSGIPVSVKQQDDLSTDKETDKLLEARKYSLDHFHPLIKNIFNGQWPWVTKEMKLKLLDAMMNILKSSLPSVTRGIRLKFLDTLQVALAVSGEGEAKILPGGKWVILRKPVEDNKEAEVKVKSKVKTEEEEEVEMEEAEVKAEVTSSFGK